MINLYTFLNINTYIEKKKKDKNLSVTTKYFRIKELTQWLTGDVI